RRAMQRTLFTSNPPRAKVAASPSEIPMESTSIPEPKGFSQLPKIEQIRYVQQLWNIISGNAYDVPVPPSHLELANKRLANYRRDPSSARPAGPASEVIARLRDKKR